MSKNRSAAVITNIIRQDSSGNIVFTSGSTTLATISTAGQLSGSTAVKSATTASYADNFTVAGTLTAQTLVVQTITSSVSFITGSTKFGSLSSNTHTFTGSLYITGSVGIDAASSFRFNGVGDTSHAVGYDSTVDGAFLRGQNGIRFLTGTGGGTERMRISGSGNIEMYPVSSGGGLILGASTTAFAVGLYWKNDANTAANFIGLARTSNQFINGSAAGDMVIGLATGKNLTIGNGQTGTSEYMRITSAGNVGIGTTSPSSNINSSSTPVLVIKSTTAGAFPSFVTQYINGAEGGMTLAGDLYFDIAGNSTATNNNIIFRTTTTNSSYSVTERMRITSGGKIEINTTVDGMSIVQSVADKRSLALKKASGDTADYYIVCDNISANKFLVTGTGVLYATNTSIQPISSDINLKTDIKDYDKGLAEILAMKPRYYKYKNNLDQQKVGFIAQEINEALEGSMVDGAKDPETNEVYKTYNVDWYPLLVKAIQELKAQNDDLQSQINELKAQ